MPDLLGSIGRSTRAVDAQHHSLHVLVLGEILQVGTDLLCVDHTLTRRHGDHPIDDVAHSIVDGDLVALLVLRSSSQQVGHAHLRNLVIGRETQFFLHRLAYLVRIEQPIHHPHPHMVLGSSQRDEAVCVGIKLLSREAAALAHGGDNVLPDAREVGRGLLPVRIAHLLARKHLRGALVRADLCHLHADIEFGQQVLDEDRFRSQAVPIDLSLRIEIDLVGHRGQIISPLRIGVAIGDDPLSGLAELLQFATDGSERGVGIGGKRTRLDIDTLDFITLLGLADGLRHRGKSQLRDSVAEQRGEHVVVGPLRERPRESEHQYGVVRHWSRLALGERHAHQADHHEKARDETYKQHTDRRSQYVFEKVLHILTICLFRVTIRAGERDSMCRNHFCHETLPALAANPNPTIVQAGASPLQR